jgi:protein-L-isoaspartate(D-aspartate) O-methyltransferase
MSCATVRLSQTGGSLATVFQRVGSGGASSSHGRERTGSAFSAFLASAVGIALACAIPTAALADDTPSAYREARARMIKVIRDHHDDTRDANETGGALDPRVLQAMDEVPRHEFVPESIRASAYEDRPLPIGHGQTISQPYIVALMTARIKPDGVVLEVGTGSGYQAAVLAKLASKVYSIEIVEPLGRQAAERLHRLGYTNVEVRIGDGYAGWPEHAPFDAILVTAAPDHVPEPLIEQLKPGGRLVVPVGMPGAIQELMLIQKDPTGRVTRRKVISVSFVPLTGDR